MAGNYILMSLSITILFFILHDSLAFDYYQSCEPITCGGLTIKYPFYIKGQQEPICGYPGFQVTCVNKSNTIFNLSNNDYVISNISYVLKTVNMVNLEFVQSSFDCNIVRHNLTLKGTMLEFATKHEEVYLLQNCSDEAKRSIREYREGKCHDENNEYGELLAAFGKDIDLNKVAGRCGRVVLVPYQGQNDSDLYGGMKIPFELRWKVGKCLESCGESNGRCGYNMTSSQLVCLCPDCPQPDTCPGNESLFLSALNCFML